MSARSFRSVFMVASCAGAALGCYLVSLRVASERAALEKVETEIVLAQRDIRLLQTEIGTRGRLAQLERWNVRVLALSAPSADQFLDGGFALAKLVAPQDKIDLDAPVVLAAAPADGPKPQVEGRGPSSEQAAEEGVPASQMLHTASLKRKAAPDAETAIVPPGPASAASSENPGKGAGKAQTANKAPAVKARPALAKPKPAPGKAKSAAADGKAVSDPLAPLGASAKPNALGAPKKLASTTRDSGKDSGSKQ